MDIKKMIKKDEEKAEDQAPEYVELEDKSFKETTDINVRIETLKSLTDTDRIQYLLREGNIVFLKISDLKQKDLNELKRAVEKLKKTTGAIDGDIIGVDETFLILTPQFARIHRG
jgi:SepF-like predicted cell division protein (DUF552 family)